VAKLRNCLILILTAVRSLQTWISVGGWSFNDPTNSPNTQQAFSNMVSSSANRQAFISSLVQVMKTYSFDGVDLDWEYPGAPDRGGIPDDTANFVALLQDMRATFGNSFGISATLPSSYWYLRWFDLAGMEQYVDWFNFMSYDLHGVWDGTNQFTGPYVLPHTNLTEIDEGLDLLWRNNINPAKVTLGLGWYGRSFTLADSSCNTPGCVFSAGGNAGPCTGTSGILSNAEITTIISQNSLTPSFDPVAAVKWITWDSNQWVSYDDGQTVQLKITYANQHCLGGTM
jgi:chitinase